MAGKRFAGFYAEVLASEDEQSKSIEDWDNIELRQVPVLNMNDDPIIDDADLPPPDQKDLLPVDAIEFPKTLTDASGQQWEVDRATGELQGLLPEIGGDA